MKQTYLVKTMKRSLLFLISLIFLSLMQLQSQTLIEAENYSAMYGIQTETCSEGGLNVGWIDVSDWMEYVVDVPASGEYLIEIRVASPNNTGQIILSKSGQNLAIIDVPNTGGWQNWTTISVSANLIAGVQTLAIYSSGYGYNVNWWQYTLQSSSSDTESPTLPTNLNYTSTESSVALSWDASTDNVGVSWYTIYQNGISIGNSSNTTFTASALAPETSYTFGVEAYDAAGNSSSQASIVASTQSSTLTLLWADEFDYIGLPDSTKWGYDVGGHGWGNDELQYYTDKRIENSHVENGVLTIEAIQETYETNDYTSARLVTRGKGDWTFGRYEVRAKLPYGNGTWAAIWMLPTDWAYGGWPESGEIDIMEHVGYDMGNIHASTHSLDYNFQTGGNPTSTLYTNNVETEFHTYAIEWYPDRIEAFVDDVLYFTSSNNGTGWESWPFDKPFHVILNIAVGGNWGGAAGVDPNIWPQKMEVDYVRVYDLVLPADTEAPNAPTNLAGTSNTPSSLDLSWDHATDNYSITEYEVYQDGILQGSTKYTGFNIGNLEPSTSYNIGVKSVDLSGNKSEFATIDLATSDPIVTTVAGMVQAEDFNAQSGVQKEITSDIGGGDNVGWIDASDWMEYSIDALTTGSYTIDFRFASASITPAEIQIQDGFGNVLVNTTLTPTGDWQVWETTTSAEFELNTGIQDIKVIATIGGFNLNWMEFKSAPIQGDDVEAPSAPSNLAKNATATTLNLSWIASTDNIAVAGYKVYLNGMLVGSTQNLSYQFTNLSKKTAYSIGVSAYDAAGNESAISSINTRTKPKSAIGSEDSMDEVLTFKVFPNPVKDQLTIQLTSELNGSRIDLFDMSGKKVLTKSNIITENFTIDMSQFSNGVYILRVIGIESINTIRIIKE